MYYKSPKLAIFLPFSVILRTFLGQNEKHDKFNCYLCALDSGGKSGQDAPTRASRETKQLASEHWPLTIKKEKK